MAAEIWVNTGSGNGLLPDGAKPLPERMLTNFSKVQWHASEGSFKFDTSTTVH